MNKEEVLRIIKEENLTNYNWFEDHDIEEQEVGIFLRDGKCIVYTSSERCTKESEKYFENESEALENFLKRLRAGNRRRNRNRNRL